MNSAADTEEEEGSLLKKQQISREEIADLECSDKGDNHDVVHIEAVASYQEEVYFEEAVLGNTK